MKNHNLKPYPLSSMQQKILFSSLASEEQGLYIDRVVWTLHEDLRVLEFRQAWQKVIEHNPNLRTSFNVSGDSEPIQTVHPQVIVQINEQDWSQLLEEEQKKRRQDYLKLDQQQHFDLNQAPLMRLAIMKLGEKKYQIIWSFHSILLDKNSIPIILKEVFTCYQNQDFPLASLPPYQTYIEWLQQQDLSQAERFWREELKGFTAPTPLIEKSNNNIYSQSEHGEESIYLPQTLSLQLASLVKKHELSLQILVQGVWALLLSRYSREEDIVFFGLKSCRHWHPQGSSMVGVFTNPLPVRVNTATDIPVILWLKQFRDRSLHSDYLHTPLTKILEWSQVPRGVDLAESLVIFEDTSLNSMMHSLGKEWENQEFQLLQQSDVPLTLLAYGGEEILIKIEYDCQRFDQPTITRMLGHLQVLLEGIATYPEQNLSQLPLLTQAEEHQLLIEWNQTQTDYPKDKCIHHLFEAQVEQTPDAIAVVFEQQKLTYRELNEKANQLAHYLQKIGIQPDILVGMCVERCLEMIVTILGILKAGGAYLPLDPAYPQERLGYMFSHSQISVLITQQKWLQVLPNHAASVVCWETVGEVISQESKENPISQGSSTNLAYVMYTSGSTGIPKGVSVVHRGVVRLVKETNYVDLSPEQTFLQLAPISFDASTLEIWAPLLNGGQLVIFPPRIPSLMELGKAIQDYQITTLWLTAGLFHLMVDERLEDLKPLRQLLAGGDVLSIPHVQKCLETLPNLKLINGYGPTENTTFTCCYSLTDPNQIDGSIPIGKAIANTHVYILDSHLQPVPIGVAGELYIGGDGLARDYLHRSDLTAEKFVSNPFSQDPDARLYKSGDLVRYLSDGNIEFLGRIDNQVKIRGFRIELGEIETALSQHPKVRQTAVIAREDEPGNKALVAYVVLEETEENVITDLREFLTDKLPSYMIPSAFVLLEAFALNPNGKVDRRALPAPDRKQHPLAQVYTAPQNELETILVNIWSKLLKLKGMSREDNFFDLGGNSLLSLQMMAQLQQELKIDVPIVKLFQYPTISSLAKYLSQGQTQQPAYQKLQERLGRPTQLSQGIAIIGMVGRFPGANNVDELWRNLCDGVASTTFFNEADLDPSIDPELKKNPSYVKAKGIVENADQFDAAFFGINPREAEVMDPQQRIFLEVAHEALENAGYDPERFDGLIGLYGGSGNNTYFASNICGRPELIAGIGEFQIMLANDKDFLTTRVSYKLNLKGPSISVNTACSTSLVAICQAFNSLMNHQCDLALAGGISISTPLKSGYLYEEGAMLSPDGYCRPFDAKAQGTMFNNGVGIVVLKRLEDAIRDGDRIEAVIRGVGMNNDGSGKVSFTAPSVDGQAEAIAMAYASANVNPETISYVETHGTATPLGDPIEMTALTQAFRSQTSATGFCAIGSVKSNVGHLVCAAGVTGVMKTALALKHKLIPPTLHFENPNPNIQFANTPFYVNAKLSEWKASQTPRRAGVSSFGVGGTNAHIILEEAPTVAPSGDSRSRQLLLLSAKTPSALETATTQLANHLNDHPDANLADVAYTLQMGRKAFSYRRFAVCQNLEDGAQILKTLPPKLTATREVKSQSSEIIFMFPGQGSQYLNMGLNLYESEAVFRETVDCCAEILQSHLGQDLRKILYPQPGDTETAAAALKETHITQPAIFTIEYALAKLWNHWGIYPQGMIGHSIGELVAACVGGVFSLEDALMLVAKRGQLMQALPKGSMLSVRLGAAAIEKRLSPELSIAAVNGPSLCVVSGPTEAIALLQRELEKEEVVCKFLHTSHAFHSPMMDPIVEPFADYCRKVKFSAPKIPFVSTVTTQWITPEQATAPEYWAKHLRATVRFAEGIQTLWQDPHRVLLEVGPRTTATTLARQQAKDIKQQIAIASLDSTADQQGEWTALMQAIGQLWLAGIDLNWKLFYAKETRHRLSLPTYPFERKRFWIDPKPSRELQLSPTPPVPENSIQDTQIQPMSETRKQRLMPLVKEVLESTSGLDIDSADDLTTFLEIGLDSLSLTQVALALKKKFSVKITFRHLMEDCPNLDTLADFIDQALPSDAFPPTAVAAPPTPAVPPPAQPVLSNPVNTPMVSPSTPLNPEQKSAIESLVAQQLQIMSQQLQLLGQGGAAIAPLPATTLPSAPPPVSTPSPQVSEPPRAETETETPKPKKSFGPGAKIDKSTDNTLTSEQQSYLDKFIAQYTTRTQESKRQTQGHRRYLADPRTVSGFSLPLKEIVYPIVTDRSSGSKLWDVDGNEYVDLTNGFGLNFFGWSPPFVTEAIAAQLKKGMEIGPQTPLAGKVAKLLTEFTGLERVAFCNTGSEAVMAAMRLARTVTGRNTIAIFSGAYHGTFDEVIVRGSPKLKSFPAAPGIMPSMFENVLVLDYGTPESLEILRDRADELAAIMVEPVQSRRPELQPKEFLQEIRRITERSGTACIFDEVVTGFRVHPGGAQAYFGIQADLATYGKVIGGGLPIGVVAGKSEFMDALDGGHWQFGDSSFPEVGVTFFAGTFVRHPLALAAAEAVLERLKEGGPELQRSLSNKVDQFVTHLKQHLEKVQAPIEINHFSSFFYVHYPPEVTYGGLLFYLLREKGVHIWEHRPCFFTLAHSDADIALVMEAFKDSIAQMQAAGFLPKPSSMNGNHNGVGEFNHAVSDRPPQPGAKLGRDPEGNPAWYIPDPERPGKYLQIGGI